MQTFLEWLVSEGKYRNLVPFSMLDRIQDNDVAEGDWEAELTGLVMRWAGAIGSQKDILKQKVDDFAAKLLEMGNSPSRIASIITRATHDQKGSFIKTAQRHGRPSFARV